MSSDSKKYMWYQSWNFVTIRNYWYCLNIVCYKYFFSSYIKLRDQFSCIYFIACILIIFWTLSAVGFWSWMGNSLSFDYYSFFTGKSPLSTRSYGAASDIFHVLEAAGLPVKHALLKDQLNFVKLTSPVEGAGKELFLFSHQKKIPWNCFLVVKSEKQYAFDGQ